MKYIYLVLLALLISAPSISQDVSDDRGYIVKVGDKAPDFEMELTNGDTIKLSELRGKVIMLQFTASWCGVCRKEMPYIESDIWNVLKDREDFALFGIDRDEPLDKVIAFGEKVGITYPLGLDPGAEIFKLFAMEKAGITRNVIINKEGEIIFLTRLFNHEEFSAMKERLFAELE